MSESTKKLILQSCVKSNSNIGVSFGAHKHQMNSGRYHRKFYALVRGKTMNEHETFDDVMKDCGIDPDNAKTEGEKATLGAAYATWGAQQRVIDKLQTKIDNFKHAFNSL